MTGKMQCQIISWHQVHSLCRALALAVHKDGFRPDAVVTIARGGYVPARILCDYLDVTVLSSIRIEHYIGARKKQYARLVESLSIDIKDKNILLADDVNDTGDTLQLAMEHLQSFKPRTVKSAVMHHKTVSNFIPDYYAHKIIKWRWIIYPWALMEDISGFISKMKKGPASRGQAARFLAEHYAVKVSDQVLRDILAIQCNGLNKKNSDRKKN